MTIGSFLLHLLGDDALKVAIIYPTMLKLTSLDVVAIGTFDRKGQRGVDGKQEQETWTHCLLNRGEDKHVDL